ncbi:MAG: 16S rRNA (adenine(1518)-N(6)/adenine(1519)-N(6))-dimethyltransferase RsmA [Saprospiraceae bacterium]
MRAKKSYGQHFLRNEQITEDIAKSLLFSQSTDNVLEIGPGKGMLTKYLLKMPFEFKAVEADEDMVFYLRKHFPEAAENIIYYDFMKLNLPQVFDGEPFSIIGNFPYNISSQILFRMLDVRELVPELVGMFQKEVAQRIVSGPGSKAYGVISVLIQAYYNGTYLFEVDKSEFDPPPKVQSAVIRLERKDNQDLGCNPKLFKSIVKQSFSQRRKMLRNTMKTHIKGHPFLQEEFFKQRPEELSVEDFVWLTQKIEAIKAEDQDQ